MRIRRKMMMMMMLRGLMVRIRISQWSSTRRSMLIMIRSLLWMMMIMRKITIIRKRWRRR
jgi:hypothetical protein